MRSPCCVCLCVCVCVCIPLWTFEWLNLSLWNLVLISWQQIPSQRRTSWVPPISLCAFMFIPSFIVRKRLVKHNPAASNTHSNSRIVVRVIFCPVRVLSKARFWICLCIPLTLLGNNYLKTLPRQRRIVGDVVFYSAHVVSKESRRLVLLRTSCFFITIGCKFAVPCWTDRCCIHGLDDELLPSIVLTSKRVHASSVLNVCLLLFLPESH
jgi:hypothetical protein